jgi:ABC-type lipoprotein export system ATPase subunit
MIRCRQLTRLFATGGAVVRALEAVDLEVPAGQFVRVRGPSGCGKTTLLLTLGGMLRPSSGQVVVDGQDLYGLSVRDRGVFRAEKVGFVFQMFHLVPYLSVLENVLLAAGPGMANSRRSRAEELLERLGLSPRRRHRPGELSAGERQRTAVARALLNQPKLILADEPTGNLDPDNAAEVLRHLREYQAAGGTVILVTHGPLADGQTGRVLQMRAGQLSEEAAKAQGA